MFRDLVDPFRAEWVRMFEALDDRATVLVEQYLADHGVRGEPDHLVGEAIAGQFPDESLEPLMLRTDEVADEMVESLGGLDHFPSHDAAVGTMGTVLGDPGEEVADESAEPDISGQFGDLGWVWRCGAAGRGGCGLAKDGCVERFLVSEMITDRRDVGAGPAADFPNGGGAEATFGEHLGCGDDQVPPGGAGDGFNWMGGGPSHDAGDI